MTLSTADQNQIGAASQLLTATPVTRTGSSLKQDSALEDGVAAEMIRVDVAALGSACSLTMGSKLNASETEVIASAKRSNQSEACKRIPRQFEV
jgi:hypothetical protein